MKDVGDCMLDFLYKNYELVLIGLMGFLVVIFLIVIIIKKHKKTKYYTERSVISYLKRKRYHKRRFLFVDIKFYGFDEKDGKAKYAANFEKVFNHLNVVLQKYNVFQIEFGEYLVLIEDNIGDYFVLIDEINRFLIENVSFKMGLIHYDEENIDIQKIYDKSHLALNEAFNRQQDYMVYSKKLEEDVELYKNIEPRFIKALKSNLLEVHYQPQVSVTKNKVIGLEALIRWFDQKHQKFISPSIFLPIAEKHGLMPLINELVVKKAFADSKEIKKIDESIHVSINVDVLSFESQRFYDYVEEQIKIYQVDPKSIVLELIESDKLTSIDKFKRNVQKFKQMGFQLSIDDYGTGYNNLVVLNELPFDEIKIDQGFVRKIENKKNESIVKLTIDLGHSMNLRIVAEGVETKEQHDKLLEMGCDCIQGYFYAKSMPISQAKAFVKHF